MIEEAVTDHPTSHSRVPLVIPYGDIIQLDRGRGKGQTMIEVVARTQEAYPEAPLLHIRSPLHGHPILEDPEEAHMPRSPPLHSVKERIHEAPHEVGSQASSVKAQIQPCSTRRTDIAPDISHPALRLGDVSTEHNASIPTIEGQTSTEHPDINPLDEEGWRGDIRRSDDGSTTQACLGTPRELRIEHIEAYPCGPKDIEEVDLLECDIEVLVGLATQCPVDADATLSAREVQPSHLHLPLL